ERRVGAGRPDPPRGEQLVGRHPATIVQWVYGRVATDELFASGRVRASGPDPSLGPRFKGFLQNP
ncbi:MAG TPA: hypothetical protein VHA34_19865, partial [Actinomycetes bacterium]|nr:hypothetical protein [Actinomycetes bacterium]